MKKVCRSTVTDARPEAVSNAQKLGKSLTEVDSIVISHGHYDHSGGFFEYLKDNKVKVHAMEKVFGDYYSSKGGMHEISVPKEIKETHMEAFEFHNKVTELSEGIYLVPHSTEDLDVIGEKTGLFMITQLFQSNM